jgi:hypothetical protein
LEYVIRDRDVRLSILKRTRKGKRLWLNRVDMWISPFAILPELMFCGLGIGLLTTTALAYGEPLAVKWIGVFLGFLLPLSLAFKHGVRFAHGLHCRQRGIFIVDDMIGGLIGTVFWFLLTVSWGWLVLWEFLYWVVWG